MMKSLTYCLAGSVVTRLVAGAPGQEQHPARAVAQTDNYHPLRRIVKEAKDGLDLRRNFRRAPVPPTGHPQVTGGGPAINVNSQVEYVANATIGDEGFLLIIDTGSSDTWLAKDEFQCLTTRSQPVAIETCNFGPRFDGEFPGGRLEELHFSIAYGTAGGGPFLSGQMGYSDISVAGITLPKQQIALTTSGYWTGDGVSSGILGLAFPGLTESFSGDPENSNLDNIVEYPPFISTMVAQGIEPVFSLALSREEDESFIAFGGIPPVGVGEWARTKVLTAPKTSTNEEDYFFWEILPDTMTWNDSKTTRGPYIPPPFIVDSGTTLNYLPYEWAYDINSYWSEPAILDPNQGVWYAPCNATAPTVDIVIGNVTIRADPTSMLLPELTANNGEYCMSGFAATESWPYILGDVFLQGVVAVFDIGNKEMAFAKRTV